MFGWSISMDVDDIVEDRTGLCESTTSFLCDASGLGDGIAFSVCLITLQDMTDVTSCTKMWNYYTTLNSTPVNTK